MYSFYGGRPGNSFVIVKAFSSVDEMNTNFALGSNYTEVRYDEHVIINTENKNDQHNGELYRRGYNGAVYIGTIVGPAGRAPMLQMTTESDVKSKTAQQGQDSMRQQGSYSVENNSLVPGKEGNEFNDAITWASYCIKNQNNSDSTAYIGFTIPYTTFDWSIQPVTPENSPSIIRTKKDNEIDEDHPFYEKLAFQLPIGESFDNLRIGESTDFITVNGQQQSCEGVLICDYYDYSTNPPTKNIKKIGDPNTISNIQMNDKNQIIVTWKLDSTQTNLGAINEIQQIAVDDNNNLLIIYSDPTRMGDQSQLIHYNGKDWKRAGSIKTISGTKVFYQDEDPQDDERKSYDLNFHKMSDESRELQIYLEEDEDWKNIKLSSTSIKSIKPNQIESGSIDATTEIINYGKMKLDQNGTIYTEKIIEGTNGTQTIEEQVKISSNEGLFAKKGEIGGWTVGENNLSSSNIITTQISQPGSGWTSSTSSWENTIQLDSSNCSISLQCGNPKRIVEIKPQQIVCSQNITSGKYARLNPSGIYMGRIYDSQDPEAPQNASYLYNNELKITDISNNKSLTLTANNLFLNDSINPALADGIIHWKVLSQRRQVKDTLFVTVYHCGNFFWAHFDFDEQGKAPEGWQGTLDTFIPIIENDDTSLSESKKYAPLSNVTRYINPYNPTNLRLSLTVRQNGDLGISRVIAPLRPIGATVSGSTVSFTYNTYTFEDWYEPADLYWAYIPSD